MKRVTFGFWLSARVCSAIGLSHLAQEQTPGLEHCSRGKEHSNRNPTSEHVTSVIDRSLRCVMGTGHHMLRTTHDGSNSCTLSSKE
jgi:hypothetical protein